MDSGEFPSLPQLTFPRWASLYLPTLKWKLESLSVQRASFNMFLSFLFWDHIRGVQGLLLAVLSYEVLGSNPEQQHSRQAPYLLNHHSSPSTHLSANSTPWSSSRSKACPSLLRVPSQCRPPSSSGPHPPQKALFFLPLGPSVARSPNAPTLPFQLKPFSECPL